MELLRFNNGIIRTSNTNDYVTSIVYRLPCDVLLWKEEWKNGVEMYFGPFTDKLNKKIFNVLERKCDERGEQFEET